MWSINRIKEKMFQYERKWLNAFLLFCLGSLIGGLCPDLLAGAFHRKVTVPILSHQFSSLRNCRVYHFMAARNLISCTMVGLQQSNIQFEWTNQCIIYVLLWNCRCYGCLFSQAHFRQMVDLRFFTTDKMDLLSAGGAVRR